jgi:BlaI family transcriptional regulator, penicillinase repressor
MPRRPKAVPNEPLSRREREVLTILYAKGEATAAEVFEELPDFPSYNAARSTLRVLEAKGHVRQDGKRGRQHVYAPTVARDKARGSWVAHLVRTLFGGSATALVNTLIDERIASDEELARLERIIRNARTQRPGGKR